MKLINKSLLSILFMLFTFISVFKAQAQRYGWVEQLESSYFIELMDLQVKNDYIYITGSYVGTLQLGSYQLPNPNNSSNSYQHSDVFIAKYDTLGNCLWAENYPNAHISGLSYDKPDAGVKLLIDDLGNIYLHGLISDSIQVRNLLIHKKHNPQYNEYNHFFLKLNPQGEPIWGKVLENNLISGGDRFNDYKYRPRATAGLALNSNGNLVVVSSIVRDERSGASPFAYYDSTVAFDMNQTFYRPSTSGYILEIDTSDGSLINAEDFGKKNLTPTYGTYAEHVLGQDLVIDDNGVKTIIGNYLNRVNQISYKNQTINLPNPHALSATSYHGFFIMQLDANDSLLWIKASYNTPRQDSAAYNTNSAALFDIEKSSDGGFYVAGGYGNRMGYDGTIYTLPHNNQLGMCFFVSKLDNQGNVEFIKRFGASSIGTHTMHVSALTHSWVKDFKVDEEDNLYMSFSHFDSLFVDNDTLLRVLFSGADQITMKMDSMGNIINYYNFQTQTQSNGTVSSGPVGVISKSSYLASGVFLGPDIVGDQLLTNYMYDGFILKIEDCGSFKAEITAFGDTTFCSPGSVRLEANLGQGYTYQWLKNGQVINGEIYSNIIATTSGDYTVEVTDDACVDTSRAIQVTEGTALPNVQFTLQDTICENEAAFVLNTGTPAGGNYKGAGVSNGEFDPSIAGSGNHTLKYTYNQNGCVDSAFADIYVLPAPSSSIVGQTQVCTGLSGLSYFTPSSGPTYIWSVTGGAIMSGQGSNSITVSWGSVGQGAITLYEMNSAGCDTTIVQMVDIVGQQFTGNISGQDTACMDEQTTFSLTTPSLFYNWTVNGGTIQSGQGSNTVNIKWNFSGQQNLSVRLFNNCGQDTTFYDSIYVNALPNPQISGLNSFCEESGTRNYQAVSSGLSYNWKLSPRGTILSGQGTNSIQTTWSGSGQETVKLIETNSNGCSDSSILAINVLPIIRDSINASICNGNSYAFGGQNLFQGGTYNDTLVGANACDSIVTLDLRILPNSTLSISDTICYGEAFNFNGNNLTTSGTYKDTLSASNGCDSVITLNLHVYPEYKDTTYATICQGTSFAFNGNSYTQTGIFSDTLYSSYGCDSVLTLDLEVLPNSSTTLNEAICAGESFAFAGQNLNTSGTYYDTLVANNGCDSVLTLNLNVHPVYVDTQQVAICSGDQYNFNGQQLSTAGWYRDSLNTIFGCDSIVDLNLTVNPLANVSTTAVICYGETYSLGNRTLTQSGNYKDTLTTIHGCDSIVDLNLTVLNFIDTTLSATICQGETYTFGGSQLSQTGNYSDTLFSASACDSVINLNLTVLPTYADTTTSTICNGDSYTFNGQQYVNSGLFVDTLTAINGCDSILALDLTVLPIATTAISRSICQGDSLQFGGQSLKQGGTYQDTLIDVNGCDSVLNLNLTVLPIASIAINRSICQGDTLQFGGQSLTQSGTYQDTLTGENGCDSITTLSLTVQQAIDDSVAVRRDTLFAVHGTGTYQWYGCDTSTNSLTLISGATAQYYIPVDSNLYAVELIDNSCTDTSSCYQPDVITGVEQTASIEQKISVYPNPSNEQLYIQLENISSKSVSIEVFDFNGKVIISEQFKVESSNLNYNFDVSSYAKAVYNLRIMFDNGFHNERFVVY